MTTLDPQVELEKAIRCAEARAPEDYPTYHLLRGILAALIELLRRGDERER